MVQLLSVLAISLVLVGSAQAKGLTASSHLEQQIVGGEEARENEFPFMVSLQRSKSHFCGGSLVQKGWVLTAAHCVDSISGLKIGIGLHSLKNPAGAEFLSVVKAYVHPKYDSQNSDYDFALLQLAENSSYQPVVVNDTEIEINGSDEVLSTTAGWGYMKENAYTVADKLQKVDVPLVSHSDCNKAYDNTVTDRMICAGLVKGGKDSCQGDSGGPLFVRDAQGNPKLVGVVSWGEGCARPNKFGVYSKVNSVIDWISNTIK